MELHVILPCKRPCCRDGWEMTPCIDAQGVRLTCNEMASAERAEKETTQIFTRSVLKTQFVNAIQNADAHEAIMAEAHETASTAETDDEPRQMVSADADAGAEGSELGSPRPYARPHTASAPGRIDKLQASSDLTPRARIQVRLPGRVSPKGVMIDGATLTRALSFDFRASWRKGPCALDSCCRRGAHKALPEI